MAGKKKVTLELGGNAGNYQIFIYIFNLKKLACVVDEDIMNLDLVRDRIIFGAFYQSGQVFFNYLLFLKNFYLELHFNSKNLYSFKNI